MNLIKTSLLNGLAVFVRILTLLGINKLLAVYVGPVGYAALGQFQNAITMMTTFASGAINTGVTKYTAEYYDEEARQHQVWRTAGTIALIGSLLTACLVIGFRHPLAIWFLNDPQYASVFIWFAATLVFFIFNAFLLAILNGKKEIGKYVLANITGSLFALLMTAGMTFYYGLYGALVALAIFQSLAFFMTFFLCYRSSWFKFSYFIGKIDKQVAKNLFHYTLMALATAACVPISHILIRKYLAAFLGWEVAGYWEAISRLSIAYLMLITTTLSVYYLPRLAELKTAFAVKKEILHVYRVMLPFTLLFGILMYVLRQLIITILFSREFAPIETLFLGQVCGDILKIGSWILGYVMLGRAMTKPFVITEILFSFTYYLLIILMTQQYGFQGISWAYALNYLIYWITLYFLVFRKFNKELTACPQSSAI